MTATRVIIACAGRVPDPKWGGHLGVPKHLALVGDEPLLGRTARQVLQHTSDIWVTCPAGDPRYQVAGVVRLAHPDHRAGNEYDASRRWWSGAGRTVLLLGDVCWTDQALATVMRFEPRRMRWFGRMGASKVTIARWGEIFAISWWPDHHQMIDVHLNQVRASPRITRPPGWKLYRSLHGLPMGRHRKAGDWTEIDDGTDDWDTPELYRAHPMIRAARRQEAGR